MSEYLPPYHSLDLTLEEEAEFGHLIMTGDDAERLVEGVEVYVRSPSGLFLRGVVRTDLGGCDYGPRKEAVRRRQNWDVLSTSLFSSEVIPAEFVDAGLLGEHHILDWTTPGQCFKCRGPVDRMSPTGRCPDIGECDMRAWDVTMWRRSIEWSAVTILNNPTHFILGNL